LLGEQINTRRLRLRRLRETDLPLILEWRNSKTSYGPYLTPKSCTAKGLWEQFACNAFWQQHDRTFLIEKRPSGLPMGTIHYWLRPTRMNSAIICITIAVPEERGKGYGTEAQKFLVIHLFDQVGVKAVEMYTDIDNKPQQRCMNKLGFSIFESLTYDDHHMVRTGHLYKLTEADFREKAVYRYHYE
jgi:RimJ/RimL family protein N-acetyltransferase